MIQKIIKMILIFIIILPVTNCYKPLKIGFVALQAFDTAITLEGVSNGAKESNEHVSCLIRKTPVLFVVAKAGMTFGMVWFMDRLHERSRVAAIVTYIIIDSLLLSVAYNNLQVCLRVPVK